MEKFVTICARVKSNSHRYMVVWFYSFKPEIYFLPRKYIWCRLQDGGHFVQNSVLTDRDFPKTWGRNESCHWVYPGSKIIRLIRFAQHLQGAGFCRAAVASSSFSMFRGGYLSSKLMLPEFCNRKHRWVTYDFDKYCIVNLFWFVAPFLISARISNHMASKECDKLSYPFPNCWSLGMDK